MAVMTNAGLALLAQSLQGLVTYVGLGTGLGTLTSPLTNGVGYSSLPLQVPLTLAIPAGQSLTLLDALGDFQVLTALGDVIGDTAIAVQNFTANANYAAGSGVTNTPGQGDITLQNETFRITAIGGFAGSLPGESLTDAYFDPTTPSATYLEVGYFGGSTATATLNSGILVFRDAQFWAHTAGVDSNLYQADSIL